MIRGRIFNSPSQFRLYLFKFVYTVLSKIDVETFASKNAVLQQVATKTKCVLEFILFVYSHVFINISKQ